MYTIKLKIADVIIEMRSRFLMESIDKKKDFRFASFIYKGDRNPDISLEVHLVERLPLLKKDDKRIFLTRHFESNDLNWALFKNNHHYILKKYITGKRQNYILSPDFSWAKAYLLKKKQDKLTWRVDEIIYDALQIILIHYLSKREGIFLHAVGIKDTDKSGILFVGKSGQGKTTSARLWHSYSKAKVLNDDRIIVRRLNNRFFIFGSPWHGDFSDYLLSKMDRASLNCIFFIFHSKRNKATLIKNGAFRLFYPCLFPTFWDKQRLEKIISLSNSLLDNTACYRLGFKNSKDVIGFVRRLKNC